MKWLCVLILSALLASKADAGAWPRAEGTGFASVSHRLAYSADNVAAGPQSQYTALYLEYGLTPRLTLGLDAGRSVSGDGKIVLFAGWPVKSTDTGHMLSIQLGLGQIDGAGVVRPGLAYGYGFDRGQASGWFAADAMAEIAVSSGKADLKLDLTLGLAWPSGRKVYGQIQAGRPDAAPTFARIAGAVVWPGRQGYATEVGVEYGVIGDTSVQLKVGLWRDF